MLINMNFFSEGALDLNKLRSVLIRMEDTIIFALIERAQFKYNKPVYTPGHFDFNNSFSGSFLDYFLHETECLHAKVRRYTSPDEYPFTDGLPAPILKPLDWPDTIQEPIKSNINDEVYQAYIGNILPLICEDGDDGNYGSSAVCDTECLQALSKRIHFGKFIAEAKFLDPAWHDKYVDMIQRKDSAVIMKSLTNEEVEQRLLQRVRRKAVFYGQDVTDTEVHDDVLKVSPDRVADIYEKYIIPLTKEVEVEYLLHRLDANGTHQSTEFFAHLYPPDALKNGQQ